MIEVLYSVLKRRNLGWGFSVGLLGEAGCKPIGLSTIVSVSCLLSGTWGSLSNFRVTILKMGGMLCFLFDVSYYYYYY